MTCSNVRELECYQEQRKAAVTLGKFDGLHRGHQETGQPCEGTCIQRGGKCCLCI